MTISMTNIVTAVEELIEGTIGSVRTISAGDFQADTYYQGQDDDAKAVATLVKKSFDVVPNGQERTDATLSERHSLVIIRVFIRLLVAYRTNAQVVAAQRKAVRNLAHEDAESIRQALSYPGNLTQTSGAAATNLISGLLQKDGPLQVVREDWDANLYETQHDYIGLVQCTMATS